MKYGLAVPLIGGLAIANKIATGVDPSFMLSYTPFGDNEVSVKHNFPNTPHYLLDTEDMSGFKVNENQDVDFVSAVCPCAGLSLLSSGNEEQRAAMNSWMMNSAEFVTSKVRPKVFWGENAPALYSNSGTKVREQLRNIADRNGYSFSIYATNTEFHGIPQNRKRTFYFFWKESSAPIFDYFKNPKKALADYLTEIPENSDRHTKEDIEKATKILQSNSFIKFLNEKYQNKGITQIRDFINGTGRGTTVYTYLIQSKQMEECFKWLNDNGHSKDARIAEKILIKIKDSKGFWDGSFPIYKDVSATIISRTLQTIHPIEDRVYTIRECMHLMGLPHDYKLIGENHNHICQNVPVKTGTDMTRQVIKFINGELKLSGSQFLMQSNITEKVDVSQSALLEF